MAELAIHDPNYFNVEIQQKTVIVHLFHNSIPADGPREEGPEWAKEVDDIYLIGGVGPDGPTVKTVTNGEVTEWSASSYTPVNLTLTNRRSDGLNIVTIQYIPELGTIGPYSMTQYPAGATHTQNAVIINGSIVFASNRNNVIFEYNGVSLTVDQHTHISSLEYYHVKLPAAFDPTIPILMPEPQGE